MNEVKHTPEDTSLPTGRAGQFIQPRDPVLSRYTISCVLRANRLLIWATLWVVFAIYWMTQGFWILTVALLAAAGLLVWQGRRDRPDSRPPLS
jgi:Flp pilus assembly protein TadB